MIVTLLCDSQENLLGAMKVINKNAKGVCFVVSSQQLLIGVLTDGDIRRAILSGFDLDTLASKVVDKNFIYGRNRNDFTNKGNYRVCKSG